MNLNIYPISKMEIAILQANLINKERSLYTKFSKNI